MPLLHHNDLQYNSLNVFIHVNVCFYPRANVVTLQISKNLQSLKQSNKRAGHHTLILFPVSGKLLVHCVMGRSRSATLFLAYLMIYKNMTVVKAIEHVKKQRCILPNRGFLKQLRDLDVQLREQRHKTKTENLDNVACDSHLDS